MNNTLSTDFLASAVSILRQGGLLVFPTDTAYGLGCDFQSQVGIKRILKVKGRADTRFTLIAASTEQVKQFFSDAFPEGGKANEVADHYWPGPLSIVVSDQFSVRVPDHAIARQLAGAYGKPLIATSANKTGNEPVFTVKEAQDELGKNNVDLWVDGEELPQRKPSTIIRVNLDTIEVIREGAIQLNI